MKSEHEIVTSLPLFRTVGRALLILFGTMGLFFVIAQVGRLLFDLDSFDVAVVSLAGLFVGLIIMLLWVIAASKRSPGGLAHGLPNMTTAPMTVGPQGLEGALTLPWSQVNKVLFIEPKQSTSFQGVTASQVQGRSLVPQWGALGIEDTNGQLHLLSAAGVDRNKALFEALERGLAASKV